MMDAPTECRRELRELHIGVRSAGKKSSLARCSSLGTAHSVALMNHG